MKTDMTPHSITSRLKKTSELRRLCIALGGKRLKKKLTHASKLSGCTLRADKFKC